MKKSTKILIAVLAVAVVAVVAILIVCFSGAMEPQEPQDKVFTSSGMKITLTDKFREIDDDDMEAFYYSNSSGVAIMVTKEDKSSFDETKFDPESVSLKEYAEAIIKLDKLSAQVKEEDGLTYFEFVNSVNGSAEYKYFVCVFVTEDAFWSVQMGTTSNNYAENRDDIVKYAKSITFGE